MTDEPNACRPRPGHPSTPEHNVPCPSEASVGGRSAAGTGGALIPDDFDARFDRGFGLLAFTVNRHIIDHMRRICSELSMDPESAMVWGTLAHMNTLPRLPLDAHPLQILNETGRPQDDWSPVPIRLAELTQVTGLPRETVRRKLERLQHNGKVTRTEEGRWLYCDQGIGEQERAFTRKTVLQLLQTAQTLLRILAQAEPAPQPAPSSISPLPAGRPER